MRILNASDVRRALPMRDTIEAMKQAYAALSSGHAEAPLRSRLPVAPHEGLSLFMPAFVDTPDTQALAVKIVSVFNKNPARSLPLIYATVIVLQADTGKPIAMLEGGTLTAIRTGAGSGAAIDLLARPDSTTVAIFGAGAQGRTQLEGACAMRDIQKVWIFDQDSVRAQTFAADMQGVGRIPGNILVADSPQSAACEADIICTATTSLAPVFNHADLKPGVHISAIGSYTPDMQEVPAETVTLARIVVDSRAATLAETGDLLKPMQAGLFDESHIYAELGEIVLGQKNGRASAEEITYFKSVGIAVQDAMAAALALQNAEKMGLGQDIEF